MPTASVIVQDAQEQLSQVPGIGVQTYSESKFYSTLRIIFDIVRSEYSWSALESVDVARPLDGLTGHPVGDVPWTAFQHIVAVWPDTRIDPLKTIGAFDNPAIAMNGTRSRYVIPDASHPSKLMILPPSSVGTITTRYKVTVPDELEPDTEMYLDRTMLVLYTCWFYAQSEGLTPGDIEKFRIMAEKRLQQCKDEEDQHARELDPRAPYAMDQWWSPSDY